MLERRPYKEPGSRVRQEHRLTDKGADLCARHRLTHGPSATPTSPPEAPRSCSNPDGVDRPFESSSCAPANITSLTYERSDRNRAQEQEENEAPENGRCSSARGCQASPSRVKGPAKRRRRRPRTVRSHPPRRQPSPRCRAAPRVEAPFRHGSRWLALVEGEHVKAQPVTRDDLCRPRLGSPG